MPVPLVRPERPYLEWIVSPVRTPFLRALLGIRAAQRDIFSIAVHNKQALTDEVLAAYVRPHIATPERWLRLRRFFHWQLDREHNLETLRAVDGMMQEEPEAYARAVLRFFDEDGANRGRGQMNGLEK
jgi:hypothetical protein